jgi:hypothetical protein
MNTRYIALKTDMIRSRTIHDRNQVQGLFKASGINTNFHLCFESDFIITHGDEAQALIN